MNRDLPTHPNRRAPTLAQLRSEPGEFASPGAGSEDARVGLKLQIARARAAIERRGSDAARARLEGLDHADLWAGTVQDASARGLASALDEAESLCAPPPVDEIAPIEDTDRIVGKALRRRRDIPLKTDGANVRFSRKTGITLIDRKAGITQADCIRFDDRRDHGDLDGFESTPEDRARVFSPGFLQPTELVETSERTRLTLAGRLGRSFPCELILEARRTEQVVRMRIRVHNEHPDHRLRIRFFGIEELVQHRGTPGWTRVHAGGHSFSAATIVRACGKLRADGEIIEVPEAQCFGWIEHDFLLGSGPAPEVLEPNTWQRPSERPH